MLNLHNHSGLSPTRSMRRPGLRMGVVGDKVCIGSGYLGLVCGEAEYKCVVSHMLEILRPQFSYKRPHQTHQYVCSLSTWTESVNEWFYTLSPRLTITTNLHILRKGSLA